MIKLKVSTDPISKEEIKIAIQETKAGKAPGVDNINPEMIKANVNISAEILYPLFGNIWKEEKIPQEWEMGLLVKIPKKGDLFNCDYWHGITLLSIPSKVFTRVILNRIKGELETKLRKEQYGLIPQRSCTDLINVLRIIMEQSLEWNSPLYSAFVDFAKAFDSVQRKRIWMRLRQMRVPDKIITIIKIM
jgi:hypothetical protein